MATGDRQQGAGSLARAAVRRYPRKKSAATRARVLDAAAHVFREAGYGGTRLADIAELAETQTGSLYYYFSSREDLVEEVLKVAQTRTLEYVRGRVDLLGHDASAADRLREAVVAHFAAVLRTGDYTAAAIRIAKQVPDDMQARLVEGATTYDAYWVSLILAAQASGDLRSDVNASAVRLFIVGTLNSTPEWYKPRLPGLLLDELEEIVVNLLFNGWATPKGRRRRTWDASMSVPEITIASDLTDSSHSGAGQLRILDAAAKVFREKGYVGTRMADVAAEVEIRAGSLYHYIESREDLVTRLLLVASAHTSDFMHQSVGALAPGAPKIDRLAAALTGHLRAVVHARPYSSVWIRILAQVPESIREETRPIHRSYLEELRQLVRDAEGAGEIRADLDLAAVLMLLIGTFNWAVEWYEPKLGPAPDLLAEQFNTMVFDGLVRRVDHEVSSR